MANDIDFHVGRRLRRRRRLLGLTQVQLGDEIGMRFQQIQKYECGQNRVTAARLYQIAIALRVPATYFFEGLPAPAASNEQDRVAAHDASGADLFTTKRRLISCAPITGSANARGVACSISPTRCSTKRPAPPDVSGLACYLRSR